MIRRTRTGSLILALLMFFNGLLGGVLPALAADTTPPNDPTAISSSSHTVGVWSNETTISMAWVGGNDSSSGVGGYSYSFTENVTASPDTAVDTAAVDFNRPTIAGGYYHTVGITSGGAAAAAGDNSDGQTTGTASWTDIVAVSAGASDTVGLKSDGTVVAVGSDSSGQTDVSSWTDIVAVAAGGDHTVGLKSNGTAVAVGNSGYGRTDVSGWTDINAIAAGYYHTVGLKSNGAVVAVGNNTYGQTAGTASWAGVTAVAAGGLHTVGLKSDRTVVTVGNNTYGQTTGTAPWTGITAVAAGMYHTVGLKSDGTVVAVGNNTYGQRDVSSWTGIVAIAAGSFHTIGLKSDGTVVTAGNNTYGQTTGTASWTDIRQPTYSTAYGVPADGRWYFNLRTADRAGNWSSIVHRGPFLIDTTAPADPTVFDSPSHITGVWSNETTIDVNWIGGNDSASGVDGYSVSWTKDATALPDQTTDTAKIDFNKMTIAAGGYNSVGVMSDGTVGATGNNDYGQTTGTASWTDIKAVAGGWGHTVGLKSDGTVVAVGLNEGPGQIDVGSWSGITAIAAGYFHTVGLKADGTVVATGYDQFNQANLSDWTNIVAVAGGFRHSVGLKSDGTVVTRGDNNFGSIDVSGWSGITAIAAGQYHTVGLKSNGTVVAVGPPSGAIYDYGQTDVSSWTDIVAIAAGGDHTVGLKSDGTVVAVGDDTYGQTTGTASWTDIVAVAAGVNHTLGLKSDGTVVAVGDDAYGQTDVSGASDIRQPTYKIAYKAATDGAWWLNLRTADRAGHWTSTAHYGPFLVDASGPTSPAVTGSTPVKDAWTNDNTVLVNFSGATDTLSGVDGYSVAWSNSASTVPDTTVDLPGSAASALSAAQPDGDRYFHLRTRDNAGNWTSTVHYGPFKIDRTKPKASVKAPAKVTGLGLTARFRVSWSGSDAGSHVKSYDVGYKIGKRGRWKRWKTGVTALRARFTAKAGQTYYFRVRAKDRAGNTGAWSRLRRTVVGA